MKKRIVITGMGAISPVGNTVEDFWQSLLAGRSGIGPITLFDAGDYPTGIAAEVKDFDGQQYFDRKDLRMMARPTQFGVAAALMALADGNWDASPGDGPLGLASGISNCAQDVVVPAYEAVMNHSYRQVSPMILTKCFPHSTASEAARLTGFQDNVMTFSTGCTSGMNSLGYAIEQLNSGRCSSMLSVSTDATIARHAFSFFCRAGILSTSKEDPARVSRPFDARRDGGVLGEGAAAFLLETLDQAHRRRARIWVEILGFATSGIGYRVDQNGAGPRQGMIQAMQGALTAANVRPEQIEHIGCHGVSDPKLDLWETEAIKQVFGSHAYRIPVSSVKSMIGIPQNAAGHLQAVATIKAMSEGIISPTINYEYPDPLCDLDYVPNRPRRNRIRMAMVFAHGFNGSDAALVLRTG